MNKQKESFHENLVGKTCNNIQLTPMIDGEETEQGKIVYNTEYYVTNNNCHSKTCIIVYCVISYVIGFASLLAFQWLV